MWAADTEGSRKVKEGELTHGGDKAALMEAMALELFGGLTFCG